MTMTTESEVRPCRLRGRGFVFSLCRRNYCQQTTRHEPRVERNVVGRIVFGRLLRTLPAWNSRAFHGDRVAPASRKARTLPTRYSPCLGSHRSSDNITPFCFVLFFHHRSFWFCNKPKTQVETSTLLSAASTQMQQTRTESTDASVSGSGPSVGITAAASATMTSASSSGVVKFHSSAGRDESESEDWWVWLTVCVTILLQESNISSCPLEIPPQLKRSPRGSSCLRRRLVAPAADFSTCRAGFLAGHLGGLGLHSRAMFQSYVRVRHKLPHNGMYQVCRVTWRAM